MICVKHANCRFLGKHPLWCWCRKRHVHFIAAWDSAWSGHYELLQMLSNSYICPPKKEIKLCCDRQDSICEGLALLRQSCVWQHYSQNGRFALENYSVAWFWKYMFLLWLLCHWIMHYFKPHHFLNILKNITYFCYTPGVFSMRV